MMRNQTKSTQLIDSFSHFDSSMNPYLRAERQIRALKSLRYSSQPKIKNMKNNKKKKKYIDFLKVEQ